MILALACVAFLLTALEAPTANPAAPSIDWQHTSDHRILDTQLISSRAGTLLAVLQADRKLILLDAATGQIATEQTTEFAMLGFSQRIPTAARVSSHQIVLTTLSGCQPFTFERKAEAWHLQPQPFIPVIDPELPKADPEFNERLLAAWNTSQHLLTLTNRGQLQQHNLASQARENTIQLAPIGALRHAVTDDRLAIAWKHGPRVTVSVLEPRSLSTIASAQLPEATIPRGLAINNQAVVAHYLNRGYVLPLLPQIRRHLPLVLVDDWPSPTATTPQLPPTHSQFNPVTRHYKLPDAIILVTDRAIVRQQP